MLLLLGRPERSKAVGAVTQMAVMEDARRWLTTAGCDALGCTADRQSCQAHSGRAGGSGLGSQRPTLKFAVVSTWAQIIADLAISITGVQLLCR